MLTCRTGTPGARSAREGSVHASPILSKAYLAAACSRLSYTSAANRPYIPSKEIYNSFGPRHSGSTGAGAPPCWSGGAPAPRYGYHGYTSASYRTFVHLLSQVQRASTAPPHFVDTDARAWYPKATLCRRWYLPQSLGFSPWFPLLSADILLRIHLYPALHYVRSLPCNRSCIRDPASR